MMFQVIFFQLTHEGRQFRVVQEEMTSVITDITEKTASKTSVSPIKWQQSKYQLVKWSTKDDERVGGITKRYLSMGK